jgi:ComF family protein
MFTTCTPGSRTPPPDGFRHEAGTKPSRNAAHDDRVLDLLLPRRCAACGRPGAACCSLCSQRLVRLFPPVCERCGAPGAWPVRRCAECAGRRLGFATARAALLYEPHAKAVVRAWKENGRRDLSRVAAALVADVITRPDGDVLTYVPGDRDRVLRRGHSPPERLAWELGRIWSLPVRPLLVRARHVSRQRGLSLVDRRRNVAGAFAAIGRAPGAVVLVDDVYTTGSTASACASALRRAGAKRVDVVCLARAVR